MFENHIIFRLVFKRARLKVWTHTVASQFMPETHFAWETRDLRSSSSLRPQRNGMSVADVEVADVVAISGSGHTEAAPHFTISKNKSTNKQDYTEIWGYDIDHPNGEVRHMVRSKTMNLVPSLIDVPHHPNQRLCGNLVYQCNRYKNFSLKSELSGTWRNATKQSRAY